MYTLVAPEELGGSCPCLPVVQQPVQLLESVIW